MSRHATAEASPTVLLPLERFDRPPLHRRPTNILAAAADDQMDLIVSKSCAGLRHDLRTTGARLRHAFIFGRFGRTERTALAWTVSGMRRFLFPTWHSLCALTLFELARGMRTLGPECGGYAKYLNQWGKAPEKALPSAAGWTLYLHDLNHIPQAAIDMDESDPRREDIAETGVSVLDLSGLRYALPTEALRRLQATASRTAPKEPYAQGI